MRIIFIIVYITTFLVTALDAQQPRQADSGAPLVAPRVLPIAPKEILRLLPTVPKDSKVISSVATNQVSSWLITIAQRQIEGPPKDPQSKLPTRTTFTLIDSGFDPLAMGAFLNFKPGPTGNANRVFLRNCPVIQTRFSADMESAQMLINSRFILTVEARNQVKDASLAWIQAAPFEQYNIPRGPTLTTLPSQIPMASVDELNPKNNHESVSAVTTPKPDGRR